MIETEFDAKVEVLCPLGVVSDYYNLIHRHNINNYFLCRAVSFGEAEMTDDEINRFHLSTLKISYPEAIAEYEKRTDSKLGRLIAQRELPILKLAGQVLGKIKPL